VQPERGAHRLRQLGHRGLDLPQGFARGRGPLGRPRPGIGRVRGVVEAGEQAPFEAAPPRPIEGEVAHHPPDIGGQDALRGRGRIGDEPEHDILDHVLCLCRAAEDAAGAREIGDAMALEHREGAEPGRVRGLTAAVVDDVVPDVALQGRHCRAHIVTLARSMQV
jgi:hypothetical protein